MRPDGEAADGANAMATWRRFVETALRGRDFSTLQTRTRDGLVIEPLYPRPSTSIPVPGRDSQPWRIIQTVEDPDPDRGNAQALEDVRGGAHGLDLRFAAKPGDPAGLPATADALHVVLDGIDLAASHIRLEPCSVSVQLAGWLSELIARRGLATTMARAAFGLDLLGGVGALPPEALSRRVTCFAELHAAGFSGPLAELDARPIHEAGGSEAQELAAILASAVWWLRSLEDAGVDPASALPCLGASASVDRDQWLSVAKLRALRVLWARLMELCGLPDRRLPIHAETSRRMITRADPHTNILRATIAAFAAGIGGADSIAVLPFSAALGPVDGHARALARNTQHLLIEESQLHRVADPAAGSGAIEALTAALAESAWAEFQALERDGGLPNSLRVGAFQARIAAARETLRLDLASGKAPLVGATLYRHAGVEPERVFGEPIPAGELFPIRLEELAQGPA